MTFDFGARRRIELAQGMIACRMFGMFYYRKDFIWKSPKEKSQEKVDKCGKHVENEDRNDDTMSLTSLSHFPVIGTELAIRAAMT